MPSEKYLWGSGWMLLTVGDRVKAFVVIVFCFSSLFQGFDAK